MLGVTKNAIDSDFLRHVLCGATGLFVGGAAMINLAALGSTVSSK